MRTGHLLCVLYKETHRGPCGSQERGQSLRLVQRLVQGHVMDAIVVCIHSVPSLFILYNHTEHISLIYTIARSVLTFYLTA